MAKQTTPFPYMSVIGIDSRRSVIHYYNVLGDNVESVEHSVINYAGAPFNEDFYKKLTEAFAKFVENETSEEVRKIAFVVPDDVVALDQVNLPMLRSQKMLQNAINAKLEEIYLNHDNLTFRTYLAQKNRRYCTYSTAAIQDDVLRALYSACSENKMLADVLTYASASTATAISTLNPKWKNESYMFIDVKDIYTRFIFVAGGRSVGFYTLPFGLEFLAKPKYVQEDMLFDHTMAELTVLNAQERAKAKKLSILEGEQVTESVSLDEMMAMNNEDEENEGENNGENNGENAPNAASTESAETSTPKVKIMAKKTPRKLPLFMQRPIPETNEDIAKENFRVFVKWALTLIQNNKKLVELGAPKFVCVNLPKTLQFVIDATNEEEAENGLPFVRFDLADENEDLAQNLELFGGLYGNNWHSAAKF
ncbi:MAG: hypothetical protein J6S04_05880 [Clostridia bacterium]|nr:hypothetical protein [Clostridia bacterium]